MTQVPSLLNFRTVLFKSLQKPLNMFTLFLDLDKNIRITKSTKLLYLTQWNKVEFDLTVECIVTEIKLEIYSFLSSYLLRVKVNEANLRALHFINSVMSLCAIILRLTIYKLRR